MRRVHSRKVHDRVCAIHRLLPPAAPRRVPNEELHARRRVPAIEGMLDAPDFDRRAERPHEVARQLPTQVPADPRDHHHLHRPLLGDSRRSLQHSWDGGSGQPPEITEDHRRSRKIVEDHNGTRRSKILASHLQAVREDNVAYSRFSRRGGWSPRRTEVAKVFGGLRRLESRLRRRPPPRSSGRRMGLDASTPARPP